MVENRDYDPEAINPRWEERLAQSREWERRRPLSKAEKRIKREKEQRAQDARDSD